SEARHTQRLLQLAVSVEVPGADEGYVKLARGVILPPRDRASRHRGLVRTGPFCIERDQEGQHALHGRAVLDAPPVDRADLPLDGGNRDEAVVRRLVAVRYEVFERFAET